MKKKLTAILLMLCLLTGIFPAAQSAKAESFTVYVTDNTLPVYSKVSASSRKLGTMAYGESMICIAYNSSWAAVKNDKGKIGYCKIDGLSTRNPNTLSKKAYITASNVPVYRRPDTGASVMMKLKKNSSYTAVGVTADKKWVRLKNGKYYGYVQAKYISASSIETDDGANANESLNTTVYIVSNTLKAYKSASTSSKKLGTMSYGESMTLLATSGSWARIRNASGAVGYCKISGLSTANPNTLSQKVYINTDGAKIYAKPATSSKVMQKMKKNDVCTAVAITGDGSWLRLKNDGSYAYVQAKYISSVKIEDEETETELPAYVSSNTLIVYAKADEGSKKIGTMSFGETIGLLNVEDGWARVRNSTGAVSYCLYGGLTTKNPNTLKKTFYAAEDGVKLYLQPAEGASVLQSLEINAALLAVAITDDEEWARVAMGDGSHAYVKTQFISETKLPENNSPIQDVEASTVYISDTTLAVYAENSDASKVLGTMSFGEKLLCTGKGEGWARVVNDSGSVGYCLLSGITSTNPNTYSVSLYAQSAGVKVYSKAQTSSSVMKTLSLNSKVTAVAKSKDESWIRLKNGSEYGYAQSDFFATTPVESAEGTSKASKVVNLAKAQLGIKYVYAAQSPSSGFDCSGFTYYVYKNAAGITLKRTAHTQGYDSKYAKIEKQKDLKVGDLVFFDTESDGADDLCDHAGIYIGSNKFIHASSAKGEVTISDLGDSSSDYYWRTWSWGRRVL